MPRRLPISFLITQDYEKDLNFIHTFIDRSPSGGFPWGPNLKHRCLFLKDNINNECCFKTRVNKMLHLTLLIRGGGVLCLPYDYDDVFQSQHPRWNRWFDQKKILSLSEKNVLSQSHSTCRVFPKLKKFATMARARVITKETQAHSDDSRALDL